MPIPKHRVEAGAGAESKTSEPQTTCFPSLEEACAVDWARLANRFGPANPIFCRGRILSEFRGRFGRAACASDAAVLHDFGRALLESKGVGVAAGPKVAVPFSEQDAVTLAATATAELSPVCAMIGGALCAEVIKFISGKGQPVENFYCLGLAANEGGEVLRSPPAK